jgi:phosphate transport system substrate-binding protein
MPGMRVVSLALCLALISACHDRAPADPVNLDGSSTAFPLAEAVAHEFMKANKGTSVNVAFSGTGTGFVKFCRGQLDIANASRPITVEEQKACESAGVTFVELPVAHDAITIIVNAKNTWASTITVPELRTLSDAKADKKVTRWNQVRADWPDREIRLFGPGAESGTFDYFTDAINGSAGVSRKDYTNSADDEVIVKGVAEDELALGYVGHGYFERHRQQLKALAVDDLDDRVGRGPIEPSTENVARGIYRPLARPLFIYVNAKRIERPEVKTFARYFVRKARELAGDAGSVPMMGMAYTLAEQRLEKMNTGTMFKAPNAAELGVEYLLTQ